MPRAALFRDYFESGMTEKSDAIVFDSSEKLSQLKSCRAFDFDSFRCRFLLFLLAKIAFRRFPCHVIAQ